MADSYSPWNTGPGPRGPGPRPGGYPNFHPPPPHGHGYGGQYERPPPPPYGDPYGRPPPHRTPPPYGEPMRGGRGGGRGGRGAPYGGGGGAPYGGGAPRFPAPKRPGNFEQQEQQGMKKARVSEYFCATCDREFKTMTEYNVHVSQHEKIQSQVLVPSVNAIVVTPGGQCQGVMAGAAAEEQAANGTGAYVDPYAQNPSADPYADPYSEVYTVKAAASGNDPYDPYDPILDLNERTLPPRPIPRAQAEDTYERPLPPRQPFRAPAEDYYERPVPPRPPPRALAEDLYERPLPPRDPYARLPPDPYAVGPSYRPLGLGRARPLPPRRPYRPDPYDPFADDPYANDPYLVHVFGEEAVRPRLPARQPAPALGAAPRYPPRDPPSRGAKRGAFNGAKQGPKRTFEPGIGKPEFKQQKPKPENTVEGAAPDDDRIKCPAEDCNRLYANILGVYHHWREQHTQLLYKYGCLLCTTQSKRSLGIRRHYITEHGLEPDDFVPWHSYVVVHDKKVKNFQIKEPKCPTPDGFNDWDYQQVARFTFKGAADKKLIRKLERLAEVRRQGIRGSGDVFTKEFQKLEDERCQMLKLEGISNVTNFHCLEPGSELAAKSDEFEEKKLEVIEKAEAQCQAQALVYV